MSKKGIVAAVVTAAGLSSRMGDYKPLLPFDGTTIAERCISNLRNAGAQYIIVVTGHRADELKNGLSAHNVTFVNNRDYVNNEMFDSICIGLASLPEDVEKVFVTPIDIPAVKAETAARLLNTDGEFVRPVFNGRGGHPVVISAAAVPKILAHDGTMGLRGAIEKMGIEVCDVPVDDVGVLYDADTPEEYQRLLKLLEG